MIRRDQLTTRELVLRDLSLTDEQRADLVAAMRKVRSVFGALREADAQVEKADRKCADADRRRVKASARLEALLDEYVQLSKAGDK